MINPCVGLSLFTCCSLSVSPERPLYNKPMLLVSHDSRCLCPQSDHSIINPRVDLSLFTCYSLCLCPQSDFSLINPCVSLSLFTRCSLCLCPQSDFSLINPRVGLSLFTRCSLCLCPQSLTRGTRTCCRWRPWTCGWRRTRGSTTRTSMTSPRAPAPNWWCVAGRSSPSRSTSPAPTTPLSTTSASSLRSVRQAAHGAAFSPVAVPQGFSRGIITDRQTYKSILSCPLTSRFCCCCCFHCFVVVVCLFVVVLLLFVLMICCCCWLLLFWVRNADRH